MKINNLFFLVLFFLISCYLPMQKIVNIVKKSPGISLLYSYLGINGLVLLNKYRKQYVNHREIEKLNLVKEFKEGYINLEIKEPNEQFDKKNKFFLPAILTNRALNPIVDVLLQNKSWTTLAISLIFALRASNKVMRGDLANSLELIGIFGPQLFNIYPFGIGKEDFKKKFEYFKEKFIITFKKNFDELKKNILEKYKKSMQENQIQENRKIMKPIVIQQIYQKEGEFLAINNKLRKIIVGEDGDNFKLLIEDSSTPYPLEGYFKNPIIDIKNIQLYKFSIQENKQNNKARNVQILRYGKNKSLQEKADHEYFIFFNDDESKEYEIYEDEKILFYDGDLYLEKKNDVGYENIIFYSINGEKKNFEHKVYNYKKLINEEENIIFVKSDFSLINSQQKDLKLVPLNEKNKIINLNNKYYYVNFNDDCKIDNKPNRCYEFIEFSKIEDSNNYEIFTTVHKFIPYFFVKIEDKLKKFAIINNEVFLMKNEFNLSRDSKFISGYCSYLFEKNLTGEDKIIVDTFSELKNKKTEIYFIENVSQFGEKENLNININNKGAFLVDIAQIIFVFGSKVSNMYLQAKDGKNFQAVLSGIDLIKGIVNLSKGFFKKKENQQQEQLNQNKNLNQQQQEFQQIQLKNQ